MEAKVAHEAELNDLETFVAGQPNDFPGSPMRMYIKRRKEELGIAFAEKVKLSPDDQARMDEVDALEAYMNAHGIGNDNPDQPMRAYVRQRRAALLAVPAKAVGMPGPFLGKERRFHVLPIPAPGVERRHAIKAAVPGPAPKPVAVPAVPVVPVAAQPAFTPVAGKIAHGQLISIGDATPGVVIYYTTDGSLPTANGLSTKTYVAPFTLPEPATVKAMAVAPGYANSLVSVASYSY